MIDRALLCNESSSAAPAACVKSPAASSASSPASSSCPSRISSDPLAVIELTLNPPSAADDLLTESAISSTLSEAAFVDDWTDFCDALTFALLDTTSSNEFDSVSTVPVSSVTEFDNSSLESSARSCVISKLAISCVISSIVSISTSNCLSLIDALFPAFSTLSFRSLTESEDDSPEMSSLFISWFISPSDSVAFSVLSFILSRASTRPFACPSKVAVTSGIVGHSVYKLKYKCKIK